MGELFLPSLIHSKIETDVENTRTLFWRAHHIANCSNWDIELLTETLLLNNALPEIDRFVALGAKDSAVSDFIEQTAKRMVQIIVEDCDSEYREVTIGSLSEKEQNFLQGIREFYHQFYCGSGEANVYIGIYPEDPICKGCNTGNHCTAPFQKDWEEHFEVLDNGHVRSTNPEVSMLFSLIKDLNNYSLPFSVIHSRVPTPRERGIDFSLAMERAKIEVVPLLIRVKLSDLRYTIYLDSQKQVNKQKRYSEMNNSTP